MPIGFLCMIYIKRYDFKLIAWLLSLKIIHWGISDLCDCLKFDRPFYWSFLDFQNVSDFQIDDYAKDGGLEEV